MKATKKLASLLSVAAIAATLAVPTASAAVKGSLTYGHGANSTEKYTHGYIKSTELENSMDMTGWVKITAGETTAGTYTVQSDPDYNTNFYAVIVQVGKSKGSSSFNYYVDGSKRHTSTAPWNFDFR